jgi:hypothetical protein
MNLGDCGGCGEAGDCGRSGDSLEVSSFSTFVDIGDIIDAGVCGGKGISRLGGLGESGKGGPTRGDKGGETRNLVTPSRGSLGGGEFSGRSMGLGLDGKPGLKGKGVSRVRSVVELVFALDGGRLSTLAREVGGERCRDIFSYESSGEKDRIAGDFGRSCIGGGGSFTILSAADFVRFDFLD